MDRNIVHIKCLKPYSYCQKFVLCGSSILHFPLPIVLTLASDRADLYGNVAFSILVLSNKNDSPVFLKKLVFLANLFQS